jgi:hypothetical protein
MRSLLLFDVDGVLVHPVGYKVALRATLDRFAAQMGQPTQNLSDDEIAVFEACGITNEWDSGAICVAALLTAALDLRPDLRRDSLDDTLMAIQAAGLLIARPDFVAAARELAPYTAQGKVPAAQFLTLLSARTSPAVLPLLQTLLADVYNVLGAPVTTIFQTHTLGHQRFADTYHAPAPFESESYLARLDHPLMDRAWQTWLADWTRQPGHGAAIFTARPSLAPADLPDHEAPGQPAAGYAPEAELAAELVGLAGIIPLIGQGRVGWLAWRGGRSTSDYLKPSPVQALAALGAALTRTETDALIAAAALVEQGQRIGPLAALDHQPTHAFVFEDSAGGIRAARRAVELLQQAGLDITLTGVGVSPQPDKRAALAAVADHLVDDINTGMMLVKTTE